MRVNSVLAATLFLVVSSVALSAETIKLGMTTVLTGSSAALGHDIRAGIESYFKLVNEQGGVKGRPLEFLVYDDGYEPARAAKNMRRLIDDDNVLAVLGNVGTPTAIVTAPIAQEKKTLLFGAYSGGGILRPQPTSRYLINYRPSYSEETSEMIEGLIQSGIKAKEIGFFTQRDGYGDATYQGALNALRVHGLENEDLLVHGRYTRNTLNVEDAVAEFLDAAIAPKAIIMAGGYAPSAKFIELLSQELPNVFFLNVSFVGSHLLQQALPKNSKNVIVMQAVPPLDSSLAIIDEYRSALSGLDATIEENSVSLEGFIIAKIFHQGLLQIEGKVSKESIISGLESLNGIDIGLGSDIYLDKSEHQAIHDLWLTRLEAGQIRDFSWKMMAVDKRVGNEGQ